MPKKPVRSILLIDDDADEYDMVIEAIEKIDPDIKVFFMDRIEDCTRYEQDFDLILLDINMPRNDGFSWLKKIRDKRKDLPVIMYTNSSSPAHISRAYNEGATLFFQKPESFHLLIKGISKLMDLDWKNPNTITKEHVHDGKYYSFEVA